MICARDGPFRPGIWWIESKKDTRWNTKGTARFVGGDQMPKECKEVYEELKKLYGDPPNDLDWGYLRD